MSTIIARSLDTSVGPRFLSISHESLRSVVHDVVDSRTNIKVVHPRNNPNKMFLSANLLDYTSNVPELGGALVPMLWMRNDNDGTRALQVGLGFFRIVCSNGLVIPIDGALFTSIRHLNGPKANTFLDSLPDILMEKMNEVKNGALVGAALRATEVAIPNPIFVLAQLPIPKSVQKDITVNILDGVGLRKEDDINTAWGLYNAVNESIRKHSRSDYAAANRDVTLLQSIINIAKAA